MQSKSLPYPNVPWQYVALFIFGANHLMNTWQVLRCGLALTMDGYKQLAFIRRFLTPMVKKHCEGVGYQLSDSERKKVLFYYPMYTVLACAQMYIRLRGRPLNVDETKRLTLVGAMATLCDDLIDEDGWEREQVFHLLSADINEHGLSAKSRLLLALNNELKSFWKPTDKYYNQLKTALEWQAVSGRQLDPDISLDEIVHICREKNGHTSLMFATLVDEEWSAMEKQFIYQSAIVGQLTNDSFDMYFDTQKGIYTYFNRAERISDVRSFFMEECCKLHGYVMQCGGTRSDKLATIRRMSILHAFTLTALDQFQEVENKYGNPVEWKKIPRKEMVIDMALNRNRFKTVAYMKWLSRQVPGEVVG